MKQESLLTHEKAMQQGLLVQLPKRTPRYEVMFGSHHWYGKRHPDNKQHIKNSGIKRLLTNPVFNRVKYVWLDFHSIPQDESKAIFKNAAIKSLLFYTNKCGVFVTLFGNCGELNLQGQDEGSLDAYNSRGWCRLERLAAAAPVIDSNREMLDDAQLFTYDVTIDLLSSAHFDCVDENTVNPLDGIFEKESDKRALVPVIQNLCELIETHSGYAEIKRRARKINISAAAYSV